MNTINRREMLTTWRRRLFVFWVAASILVAALAVVGGPVFSTDGADDTAWVALLSPIAMMLFVVSGLAWLVLLMRSSRRSTRNSREHGPYPTSAADRPH